MELLSILLIICSALLHALWNLIGRSGGGGIRRFFWANLYGTLFLLPLITFNFATIQEFPLAIWGFLILTGFFQASYFTGLGLAYQRGSISKTYPIVRAAPIVFISFYMVLVGRGAELSMTYWLSIILICVGITLKSWPVQKKSTGKTSTRCNIGAVAIMIVTATGTAGYSLVDEEALHQLKALFTILPPFQVAAIYISLQAVMTVIWMGVALVLSPAGATQLKVTQHRHQRDILGMGIAMYITYFLVLFAITISPNVGYIVALRQLSLPLVALAGVVFFKETLSGHATTGLIFILLGLLGVTL